MQINGIGEVHSLREIAETPMGNGDIEKQATAIVKIKKHNDKTPDIYLELRLEGKQIDNVQGAIDKKMPIQFKGACDVENISGLDRPVVFASSVVAQPQKSIHSADLYGYGNLTKDAKVTSLSNEYKSLSTSIAVNRKLAGGDQKTSFFNVSMLAKDAQDGSNRLSKLCGYFTKGTPLFVVGTLEVHESKKEGSGAVFVTIMVRDFVFGARKQSGGDATANNELPSYMQDATNTVVEYGEVGDDTPVDTRQEALEQASN